MKSKGQPRKKPVVVSYQGYVRWYLNETIKKAVQGNIPPPAAIVDRLEQYANDGYKVGIKWEDENAAYAISLMDMNEDRDSSGWILSARHADFNKAMGILIHLHEKVFADGWEIENSSRQDLVNW